MDKYTFWEENKDSARAVIICGCWYKHIKFANGDSGKILEWIKGDSIKVQLPQGIVWLYEYQITVV
jgi:hypothetical protein